MKSEEINKWHENIRKATRMQSTKWKEWRNNIDFYTGDWFKRNLGNVDPERIEVSFVYSFVNTLIPAIYFRDPKIFVRPRPESGGQYQSFSEVMEETINYVWNELRLKKAFRKCIKDAILTPPGWIKVGYTAKFDEDVAEEKEKVGIDIGKLVKTLFGQGKENKRPEEAGILTDELKEESVFAQYISSWRMLLAPGYHEIEKMPYLIEIEDIGKEDLDKNSFYKRIRKSVKADRAALPNVYGGFEVVGGESGGKTPFAGRTDFDVTMVRLFHIWDRRGQNRFTLAENFTEDALFEGDWPYSTDGFPYLPLIFNDVPQTKENSNSYPISDVKAMTPQVIELSNVRTQMAKHRKRSGTVILVKKALWKADEISNFEAAEDMSIIEVSNLNPEAIQNWQPPRLPEDVYRINDIILQDLMRESGLLQLLSSQPQKGVETLGEARILNTGSELRTADKVDIIETFTVDVARYLASLIWEFYDRQKIREIIGRIPNEDEWPAIPSERNQRRRIVQAELFFRIDAGSTRPPMDTFVEQKLWQGHMMTLKTLFPNKVNDEILLEQYLKKIQFKDFDRAIIKNDQGEMQAAQEENQLLMKNIPQVVSPNENHAIHMQIHAQIQGSTQAAQYHIMEHQKFMQMSQIRQPGQGGGTGAMSQMPNTPIELNRAGTPSGQDLFGAAQNIGGKLGESGPV